MSNTCRSCSPVGVSAGATSRLYDQNVEEAPAWFISYMEKYKTDFLLEVKEMIRNKKEHKLRETKTKKQQTKRHSEDESSDNQLCMTEPRSCKILRKLEKLQKHERKLEHKLDQRLEKMESKKKRLLEKVSQTKTVKRKSSEASSGVPYLMGGISVKPLSPIHVEPGQMFSRTWELLNDGTIPWTDATEMRLAWGSAGLYPDPTVVKCPALAPGEQGPVTVIFTAPTTPGTYHSYWHLFHMAERFGHWIACTVIVEATETICDQSLSNDTQVVEKDLAGKLNAVTLADNPEYDSGSDIELCSNVSESDSVDSFVLVDVPLVFFSDKPSEKKGTIPIKVRPENCHIYSKADKKNNSKKSSENECTSTGEEIGLPISENAGSVNETYNKLLDSTRDVYQEYTPQQNNVFMVDGAGNCMIAPPNQASGIYPVLDSSYNEGLPVYPQQSQAVHEIPQTMYFYSKLSPGNNVEYNGKSVMPESTQRTESSSNIFPDKTPVYFDEKADNTPIPVFEKTEKSKSSDETPIEDESYKIPVHNLPAPLFSAINVASKAYNTAQSVFSNFRTKQGEASDYNPSFEHNLVILFEMGFTNTTRNIEVLRDVGNNIGLAVPILLAKARQQ